MQTDLASSRSIAGTGHVIASQLVSFKELARLMMPRPITTSFKLVASATGLAYVPQYPR